MKKTLLFTVPLLLSFSFSAGHAASPAKQTLVYEVYAGGIHALQATVRINTGQKARYGIVMDAKTRGFLASLVPWEGRFESHGWEEKNGRFAPELHQSTTHYDDEHEIKEYRYNRKGDFLGLKTTNNKSRETEDKNARDPALTKDTTDTLSAALEVFNTVGNGEPCEGASDVFDGSRRFTQVFRDHGTENLTPTKYNIFKGDASVCTVEVVPGAGKWHKKPRGWMSIQEQGRAAGTMPTIWLANLHANGPAVPVKIRVKTDYGTLFMHLASYTDGVKSVSAEKRAEK